MKAMSSKIDGGLRIRNMWYSDGKIKCFDCGKIIEKGLEFYNIFQDGFKIGIAHNLDGICEKQDKRDFVLVNE